MARPNPEPRMLTQQQAAQYCGIGVIVFKDVCPVTPTAFRDGLRRYDRYKLDAWLDTLSSEKLQTVDRDEWLRSFEASISNRQ